MSTQCTCVHRLNVVEPFIALVTRLDCWYHRDGAVFQICPATVLDVNEGAVVCLKCETYVHRPHRAICRHGQPVGRVVRSETGTNTLAFHLDAGNVDQYARPLGTIADLDALAELRGDGANEL